MHLCGVIMMTSYNLRRTLCGQDHTPSSSIRQRQRRTWKAQLICSRRYMFATRVVLVSLTAGCCVFLRRQGCPDLIHLMEEGEEKEEFFKLPVEEMLLRWFNHHLR